MSEYIIEAQKLVEQKNTDDAKKYLELSIDRYPNVLEAYQRLAELYRSADINRAVKIYEKLLSKTDQIEVVSTMAVFYCEAGLLDNAIKIFVRVINECRKPDVLFTSLCNFSEIMCYRIKEFLAYLYLVDIKQPDISTDLKRLIHQAFIMDMSGIYTYDMKIYIDHIINKENYVKQDPIHINNINQMTNDHNFIYEQHSRINDFYFLKNIYDLSDRKNTKTKKHRKIRVGYISSDFRQHAVGKFLENIIINHTRNKFEIYCYYNETGDDFMTEVFKKHSIFKNIHKIETKEASQLIYNDKIDILIDINGHTNQNRLDIFATKPAPIQITYLGYPNTTGLKQMDYRLTDRIVDPIDTKQKYSEKLLYIDGCFLNFTVRKELKNINVDYKNEDNKYITFGMINKFKKQSPDYLKVVKRVLETIPTSKIMIAIHRNPFNIEYNKELYLRELNISEDRLIFKNTASDTDYYKMFNEIDIVLDTFPYSGTTITCDALYMSTPIITLNVKDIHVNNVSSSIMTDVIPELITYSVDDYIKMCLELSNTKEKILKYKQTIRRKFLKKMDTDTFIKNYEIALKKTYDDI